ncbi:MAG: undecaprenyl-diphosphate phosphatase [Butyribacter sp.]|nr:undecaprenyl-diphosphate phosphatase [bacterium]MDY3853849.1 undecaprenyl-diphosphate phosphatase [Butyribacter sp.]
MPIWKAIVLGVIQGAAEFLPISSSGHLVIMKELLGIDLETGGVFFDVMLHLGTLLAIFLAFWKDIKHLIIEGLHIIGDVCCNIAAAVRNLFGGDCVYRKVIRSSYRKLVVLIIVSTIPTGILGVLLSDVIEAANGMILVPGICLLITALFLVIADAADNGNKKPKETTYWNAGAIGVAQGLATMPGISRSGTTITACLLCGFDKKYAVKYSFIMSIPAVLGAVVLEIKDVGKLALSGQDIISCATATIIAAVVGYISICFMMQFIKNKKYRYFAIYCAVIGLCAIGYYIL